MAPPRLAPNTPMQTRGAGDDTEARTVTRREPRRPVSRWHRPRWWVGHYMDRDDAGEWRDESGWGSHRSTVARRGRRRSAVGTTRAELRDEMALARYAQERRAEGVALGGRVETKAFYGEGEGEYTPTRERRIVTSRAELDRAAYEREQADAYERARRRRGEAALRRTRRRATSR